jgi:hypothetical protein
VYRADKRMVPCVWNRHAGFIEQLRILAVHRDRNAVVDADRTITISLDGRHGAAFDGDLEEGGISQPRDDTR